MFFRFKSHSRESMAAPCKDLLSSRSDRSCCFPYALVFDTRLLRRLGHREGLEPGDHQPPPGHLRRVQPHGVRWGAERRARRNPGSIAEGVCVFLVSRTMRTDLITLKELVLALPHPLHVAQEVVVKTQIKLFGRRQRKTRTDKFSKRCEGEVECSTLFSFGNSCYL